MSIHQLFSSIPFSSILDSGKRKIIEKIKGFDSDYILNVDEDKFTQFLIKKFSLDTIVLKMEEIYQLDPKIIEVDVSSISGLNPFNERGPLIRNCLLFEIVIPFTGKSEFFDFTPNPFLTTPPSGYIKGQEIILAVKSFEHDTQKNEANIKRELSAFKEELKYLNKNIFQYNIEIENLIKFTFKNQKSLFLKSKVVAQSLGIPIKKRANIPPTYNIPLTRKKLNLAPPKPSVAPHKPEPILHKENYETILETIHSMSLLMERNPSTFSQMDEPDIRNLFLMKLNALYEGAATGETFNYEGKTDILIRHENRNIFIAECKFWTGPDGLLKSIDQLFKYISWRDTKTAILLFNKNKNFSKVLEKIAPTAKSHSNYKKENSLTSGKLHDETIFSYIFHQPTDINRDLILTILVFDIPQKD